MTLASKKTPTSPQTSSTRGEDRPIYGERPDIPKWRCPQCKQWRREPMRWSCSTCRSTSLSDGGDT